MLPNFSADELRCQGSGELRLAHGFAPALQGLRDALTLAYVRDGMGADEAQSAAAMIITSACRSPEHNADVGGAEESLHLTEGGLVDGCAAVDVAADAEGDADYRERLIPVARERDWSIGYHSSFLHLDLRAAYGHDRVEFDY
ncbi:D-Ala-D-Ala carboxypeptidase family metallohydrolase [Halorhodospira sp. 9622]|uniref:D-Ala-D-Ala carboxypeptidase family metallohydrolase n=1 Tax=Halorhodospira sp. 9622 TaxID=2899136 RepID=UPI001EE923AF|nr:D-Ala-D-Ala carboxypeptidase family metallohydrolase [Halorhodospira sp. 9622]MCG5538963.1 D-Ala-D-Ala carboxypeptidase family metallohydrolase [Halorhodospira sp. 9622]